MLNLALSMLAFFAVFVLVADVFRRYRTLALMFFVVSLPSLLLPNSNMFMHIKTASVLLPTCFLVYARFRPKFEGFIYKLIYAVIALNIVEASVIDVTTGNYLNLIAAVGLIAFLPYSRKHWEISGKDHDFVVRLPAYWPYLYTTWNLCFLYSSRITTFGYALPLLLAPVAYALFLRRTELYFQARAYTFGFYLFFRTVFADADFMNLKNFDLTDWYSQEFALAWGATNVVFTGWCAYLFFIKRRQEQVTTHTRIESC